MVHAQHASISVVMRCLVRCMVARGLVRCLALGGFIPQGLVVAVLLWRGGAALLAGWLAGVLVGCWQVD